MIDVCVCTHNPRHDVLDLTLASIARQACAVEAVRVLVIDNASTPPLSEAHLEPLRENGIEARLVSESKLGVARARLRAIVETSHEWILFVDDDTELMPDYVANGLAFVAQHPDVGCFGGRLRLPPHLQPPAWSVPFLRYLAIKDVGDEPVIVKSARWGVWEPPAAGAFVRRAVVNRYRQLAESDGRVFKLGRKGHSSLESCEDSLMMRGAYALNLACAYAPDLVLYHHLDPRRFAFRYLVRLMYAYGASHVILETLHTGLPVPPSHSRPPRRFLRLLLRAFATGARESLAFGVGMSAYHFGARAEHVRNRRRARDAGPSAADSALKGQ